MASCRIAIAGCGIGGLAAAALLARACHEVEVYDAFDAPRPVGSGLVIQPVGQAVLEVCGAASARDLGQKITRMQGHEATTGQTVLNVGYGASRGRFGLAIHRASLFQSLLDAARAAGAQITTGFEIARVGDHDTTPVLIATDGRRAGPFDLVIDAAGTGSPLSPMRPRALLYGALWGVVPWPEGTDLPRDQLTQCYRRASRMIGVLPIGRLPGGARDLTAIFWSLPVAQAQAWAEAPLDAWKAEARALWPAVAPFLDQVSDHADMTLARYAHGTVAHPVSGRIAHIGDAAHRASPQLGQGANMALLDALALARALDRHGPGAMNGALAAYAAARRFHVWGYQALSAVFTGQYQSDSRLQPLLRDWLVMPAVRIPPAPAILSRVVSGDLIAPIRGLDPPG